MGGKLNRRAFISGTLAAAAGSLLKGFREEAVGKGGHDGGRGPAGYAGNGDMVLISAGRFLMGTSREQAAALAAEYGYHQSWLESETPQREIFLPAFKIDKFPVTNGEYYLFCQAAGYPPRRTGTASIHRRRYATTLYAGSICGMPTLMQHGQARGSPQKPSGRRPPAGRMDTCSPGAMPSIRMPAAGTAAAWGT
jgi:formylglycine-generating enzyme required for sulfatase activity